MTEIICAVIAAAASVMAAVFGAHAKQASRREEARARLRREEAMLSLVMLDATMQLSVVTANALLGGHNNGNVERARVAAEKAAHEYETFLLRLAAQESADS